MLQRIQTLYLLSAVILSISIGLFLKNQPLAAFYPWMFWLLAVDMIIVVFLYKKRPQQLLFAKFTIYIFIFCTLWLCFQSIDKWIPIVLCLSCIGLLFLAKKAIQKDEDLVRSADRLR